MPENIQDWLLSQGFTIEPDRFVKGEITLPFTELSGHSLGSFKTKAFRQGWVKPAEVGLGKPLPFVV